MLFEVLNQELFKEAAQEATLSELLEDHWSRCCWFQIWNVSLSEKNMQEFCNLFVRPQKGYTLFRADSSGWLSHSSNWIAFPKIVIILLKKWKRHRTMYSRSTISNVGFQQWCRGWYPTAMHLRREECFIMVPLTYSLIWSCIRYIARKPVGELFIFSLPKTKKMGFGNKTLFGGCVMKQHLRCICYWPFTDRSCIWIEKTSSPTWIGFVWKNNNMFPRFLWEKSPTSSWRHVIYVTYIPGSPRLLKL